MNPFATPTVTDEDRQRGFAELDLMMADGTRQAVRVHALSPAEFIKAARLSPNDLVAQFGAQALRESPDFVREKVSELGQLQIVQLLAALAGCEREAAEITEAGLQKAFRSKEANA